MIAFLGGAATVLAFAPFALHPLAFLTFALLVHLWAHASPRRCAWLGFWFGLGLFGAGVSWVYVSLHQFGGMPAPLAGFATVGLCAFLALFPAAAGWLQARVPAPDAARAALLIPAAWVLFEWLLVWIFTGFPWLAVGYAAAGWPLQGYAPLGGVYLLSFLTVSVAGMLWLLLRRRPGFLIAVVLALGIGEALRHVPWTQPAGEPVTAALLQGNIEQEMKFRPERAPRILETYARLAEGTRARLIVFPETALPRFFHQVDPAYLARLEAAARRNGGDLILGVPYLQERGTYYNSALTLGTSPPQAYHKVHLVPFGEFVPLQQLLFFVGPLVEQVGGFTPGRDMVMLPATHGPISTAICYEIVFPRLVGESVSRGSQLLTTITNDAWYGESSAPYQHFEMASMRAIEQGRYLARAANTGISGVVDPYGRVVRRSAIFEQEGIVEDVRLLTSRTIYSVIGDAIAYLSIALTVGALIAINRRRLRRA